LALAVSLLPLWLGAAQPASASQAVAAGASVDSFETMGNVNFTLILPLVENNSCFSLSNVYTKEPYYTAYQWDMDMIHADWAFRNCQTGAHAMIVAVIDSGVDLTHPDLAANLLPGKDFVDGDNTPQDTYGHGTHVSGTIAAALNGIGIVGVAPSVKILPVRVLDGRGNGSMYDVAQGIIWAADAGAKVINLSLGGAVDDPNVHEAVDYAIQKGAVVVAASGNHDNPDGSDNVKMYPAAYPGVLAVAAVDSDQTHAWFSNYGSYVGVSAPGVHILSAYLNGDYAWLDGTSMASPHVAGLAALIRSAHPEYSVAQVIDAIEKTALSMGTGLMDRNYYGAGIIQVDKALAYTPGAPAPLTEPPVASLSLPADRRDQPIATGTIIVHFKPGADEQSIQQQLGQLGLLRTAASANPLLGERISVPAGAEWQMVNRLRALPGVESAAPDYLVSAQ
jgi:type VII secretion-associated serine protease mycosin